MSIRNIKYSVRVIIARGEEFCVSVTHLFTYIVIPPKNCFIITNVGEFSAILTYFFNIKKKSNLSEVIKFKKKEIVIPVENLVIIITNIG